MALARLPNSFHLIREAARAECSPISLGQLLRSTGRDPQSLSRTARWLHRQLPIRFARRIEDILGLPHVVVSTPSIHRILKTYLETFESIREFPEVRTEEQEAQFFLLIRDQMQKHNPGTQLVAEGYRDVRMMYPEMHLDTFLNDLFTTRIATRILMENYLAMRSPQEGYVGVVCQGMRPVDIVGAVAKELTPLTEELYGVAPEVEYTGNLDTVLDYIPRHVHYMVREVLKNAFRATIERHLFRKGERSSSASAGGGSSSSSSSSIPAIQVELQQGDIHVIIKIADQGGGMPKPVQATCWQYGWTTVSSEADESVTWGGAVASAAAQDRKRRQSELAGYGFGLPLTRLHAQYFGGDVNLQALPGHGTNMYLILTHLKEGTPSTEIDDLSTELYRREEDTLRSSKDMP